MSVKKHIVNNAKKGKAGGAAKSSEVDLEAIKHLRHRMETLSIIPILPLTSEEMGLTALDHVLPDTWENISWVI